MTLGYDCERIPCSSIRLSKMDQRYSSGTQLWNTAQAHSSVIRFRNTVQERVSGGRSRLRFRTSNWHGIRSVFQVSVPARVSITRFKPAYEDSCAHPALKFCAPVKNKYVAILPENCRMFLLDVVFVARIKRKIAVAQYIGIKHNIHVRFGL